MNDNAKTDTSQASMLLDSFVTYRSNENTVAFKLISSTTTMLGSSMLHKLMAERRFYHAGKQIIMALPVELNPLAIEQVFSYIHGNIISSTYKKGQPQLKELIEKCWIVARYLEVTTLQKFLTDKSIELGFTMAYDSMEEFIQGLPKPEFVENFLTSVEQLPSRQKGKLNFCRHCEIFKSISIFLVPTVTPTVPGSYLPLPQTYR